VEDFQIIMYITPHNRIIFPKKECKHNITSVVGGWLVVLIYIFPSPLKGE